MTATGDDALGLKVQRAKDGDGEALEQVIRAVKDDVYRLALRMTGHPEEASDATQEILVKVVTRLEGFRGDSGFRTWVYRIAVNHVLDRKKSRIEQLELSFERFGADLLDGLAGEPDGDPLLAEEVKRGCTLAMLTCLDREHRLAYILSDVFDLPAAEAAALCSISEEAHRQRASRARRALEEFTLAFCGVVNSAAPCSCARRVARARQLGRVDAERARSAQVESAPAHDEMESLHACARLMRSHPAYAAPESLVAGVRAALRRSLRILS